MADGSVVGIFVTPDAGGVMHGVDAVHAVEGKGLEGDRYFDHGGTWSAKPGLDCQVTLIEAEAVDAVGREYNLALDMSETRRNLVTRGVPLNHLVGREFSVGEVVLQGVGLCEPCGYLERKTREGIKRALVHRGGLRARVVRGGVIRTGSTIAQKQTDRP